jgi:hypothetical protein
VLVLAALATGMTLLPARGETADPASPLVLPRRAITPGIFNGTVRQGTIGETICVSGWTKTVRPPTSYTNKLKLKQMEQYGETGLPSDYEEDHLIPLELGGAPRDPRNLWPEPRAQASHSDPLESKLKRSVCHSVMTLAKARLAIRRFKRAHG